jgi:hypothetical protein
VQKAAEKRVPAPSGDINRLKLLVLVRTTSAGCDLAKSEIVADLAPLAGPRLSAPQWRRAVERAIEALACEDLISAEAEGYRASEAGAAAAAKFLGVAGGVPRSWNEVCDLWLIAKALGAPRVSAKRLAALGAQDGLRAAILVHAYGLRIKGVATPARLRGALAATALKRAFGEEIASGLTAKLGLSARASRLLAAQLLVRPRDPGTDRRLVAALAAQSVSASGTSLGALRLAVLRQFFGAAAPPMRSRRERRPPSSAKDAAAASSPVLESSPVPESPQIQRLPCASAAAPAPVLPAVQAPDLRGFAVEVRRLAASEAHGWSGDRKAYISHVWRNVRDRRPEWGLSEIEFKCMLAEAHRSGQLALANADLKDKSNIKDVQDSAVVYRNAVFHFIRVDS